MENNNKDNKSNVHTLDDEQRIKILSPSMLIAKRFIRNRLAIIGLIIIAFMFLFSFVGGAIYPYDETEKFYKTQPELSHHASATINDNMYYTTYGDKQFTSSPQSSFILAINKGKDTDTFEDGGVNYRFTKYTNEENNLYTYYLIENSGDPLVRISVFDGEYEIKASGDFTNTKEFEDTLLNTLNEDPKATQFMYDNKEYFIQKSSKTEMFVVMYEYTAVASKMIYNMYTSDFTADFTFKLALHRALMDKAAEFTAGGSKYAIKEESISTLVSKVNEGNTTTALIELSDLIVTPSSPEIFLSIGYKDAVREAMESMDASKEKVSNFTYPDEEGNEIKYIIERKDMEFTIKSDKPTTTYLNYDFPSLKHPLGTDKDGMDLLIRLMYGGRVSLIIGFVVVIIEIFLGVIVGGLSGYFSGWVDTLLMRVVEIMNCIPTMPLFIIIGVAIDKSDVNPRTRIFLLMVVLGVTGWPSIARVVRGQILSLREQEFMTATEASGLSVSRRVFRHLVPNVIPQLIVYATMGLGSVILTEATLSFLNLGVKYPYASWGNIINSVNESFVLTNYWFVWIPAGCLILLTVLGFNFIGDGLRDAFDPRMKR